MLNDVVLGIGACVQVDLQTCGSTVRLDVLCATPGELPMDVQLHMWVATHVLNKPATDCVCHGLAQAVACSMLAGDVWQQLSVWF